MEKYPNIVNISRQCTKASFLGGTSVFLVFMFFKSDWLLPFGLLFTLSVGFINSTILVVLLFNLYLEKKYKQKIMYTALLMLCNIPIAATYAFIVVNTATIDL